MLTGNGVPEAGNTVDLVMVGATGMLGMWPIQACGVADGSGAWRIIEAEQVNANLWSVKAAPQA